MSARDDFGSTAGRPGGYGGGAGGLGNGGVGGGMGGGYAGGGAGINGGINSRTGLTTGNRMLGGPQGVQAMGRPGGMAMNPQAWGRMPSPPVTQGPIGRPPGLLDPAVPPVAASAPPPPQEPAWPWANPAVYNPYPQWSGQGSWNSNNAWNNDATTWPKQPGPASYDKNLTTNNFQGQGAPGR
jgi:hypothetical protein